MGGRGAMTKAPMSLQDLRRKIDGKAPANPAWRFWGLDVQVGNLEPLREAYGVAKANNGAPGIDGVTFEDMEARGVEPCLEHLRDARGTRTYPPMRGRRQARPQDGGTKVRVLGLPTMRDRVVQGALKVILTPVFEADLQPGSSGDRPTRSAPAAVERVAEAIARWQTRGIEVDLQAYCDNIRPPVLLAKVAARINDADVRPLFQGLLKASGSKGVPHGGVSSPLLSPLYRTEVDRMLERAQEVTQSGTYTDIA
jgi:RNA-directed DNA polymerase